MKSLHAKFHPFSFKTEGGVREWRTVKMQNFKQPLMEQKSYQWFLLKSLSRFTFLKTVYKTKDVPTEKKVSLFPKKGDFGRQIKKINTKNMRQIKKINKKNICCF